MQTPLKLVVTGMHCDACVRRVTTALQTVPSVDINLVKVGSAQLTFDPNQADPSEIIAAVNRIGFAAQVEK